MAFEPNISVVGRIGTGFLAVMPKPKSGEWIEEEFANISAFGVHQVVSLLEPDEAAGAGLQDESLLCQANGMKFVSYPMRDRSVPGSVEDFSRFTYKLFRAIAGGSNTVVHCLAGIGRSGIVSCAVLVHSGMGAREAFEQISRARRLRVPDTETQRDWLIRHQGAIRKPITEDAEVARRGI